MSVNLRRWIVWSSGLALQSSGASLTAQPAAIIEGDLGFRQHTGGHTPEPTWPTFIAFAEPYFVAPKATASRSSL